MIYKQETCEMKNQQGLDKRGRSTPTEIPIVSPILTMEISIPNFLLEMEGGITGGGI